MHITKESVMSKKNGSVTTGDKEGREVSFFTHTGREKIQNEIERLEEKLQELVGECACVAGVGSNDWHENGAHEPLERDIQVIKGMLSRLYDALRLSKIVEPPSKFDRVAIGTSVRLVCERNGYVETTTIEIVGFGESDLDLKVAYDAPLAVLIMGSVKGQVIKGKIGPQGQEVRIEILKIGPGEEILCKGA